MREYLRHLYARALRVWDLARQERSSPAQVGWSVGVGVFAGCTPLVGLHMWVALGLATIFRLNRLWAFVGSRISFTGILVWIACGEIELGHRTLQGRWLPLSPAEALEQGRQLLADWFLGAALVGPALGVVLGLVAYGLARRWPVTPRTPDARRPPTSESPPSAPPAQTS